MVAVPLRKVFDFSKSPGKGKSSSHDAIGVGVGVSAGGGVLIGVGDIGVRVGRRINVRLNGVAVGVSAMVGRAAKPYPQSSFGFVGPT